MAIRPTGEFSDLYLFARIEGYKELATKLEKLGDKRPFNKFASKLLTMVLRPVKEAAKVAAPRAKRNYRQWRAARAGKPKRLIDIPIGNLSRSMMIKKSKNKFRFAMFVGIAAGTNSDAKPDGWYGKFVCYGTKGVRSQRPNNFMYQIWNKVSTRTYQSLERGCRNYINKRASQLSGGA